MGPKGFLFSAVLLAGSLSAMAQATLYSSNVVGFVTVPVAGGAYYGGPCGCLTIPNKFQMIANPLNATNNTIGSLIPAAPNGTILYKFTGDYFAIATYLNLVGWDHPEFTLNPGEGAILCSPTNWTLTFFGEVLQGSLTDSYPAGFCIRASQVPETGTLTALGFQVDQLSDGDTFYQFNPGNQSYEIYVWFLGTWGNVGVDRFSEPTLGIGESMWFQTQNAGSWNRTFTVQ
jgi:hypothetical protein